MRRHLRRTEFNQPPAIWKWEEVKMALNVMVFGFLGMLFVACGIPAELESPKSSLKTVAFSRWNKKTLDVCWEFTSNATQTFRSEIENQVTRAYERTVVKFVGWQKCTPEKPSDVRLFVYDDAGSNWDKNFRAFINTLVAENNSKKPGAGHPRLRDANRPMRLVLNRTFKDVDPDFQVLFAQLNSEGKRNIALTAAIHEFGHVIGLRHEDAHPERTCDDFAELPGDAPGEFRVVSAYNPFSFMSRCYYRTFNFNLSIIYPNAKDVEGINLLYADSGI
jgi:hypothetical protein